MYPEPFTSGRCTQRGQRVAAAALHVGQQEVEQFGTNRAILAVEFADVHKGCAGSQNKAGCSAGNWESTAGDQGALTSIRIVRSSIAS